MDSKHHHVDSHTGIQCYVQSMLGTASAGSPVNDFLSWGLLWSPISKISFMTYLFHMSPNIQYFAMQDYNVDFSMWLLTEIFVAQLTFDLLLGLIGCLTLDSRAAIWENSKAHLFTEIARWKVMKCYGTSIIFH